MDDSICAICKQSLTPESGEFKPVTQKGADGINNAAAQRGDTDVHANDGDVFHTACRKDFTNKNLIKAALSSHRRTPTVVVKRKLRSEESSFDPKHDCIYCGKQITFDTKTKDFKGHAVKTENFEKVLRETIDKRKDKWATQVLGRLNHQSDCFAADNVYHHQCDIYFRQCKDKPQQSTGKRGRPSQDVHISAFETAVGFLESSDEPVTISDLQKQMERAIEGEEKTAFSRRHIKRMLIERFGDEIHIAEDKGKADVVTLKKTASRIIHNFHQDMETERDDESEKNRIISAAASLILSDIKSTAQIKDPEYPTIAELESDSHNTSFIPASLKLMLEQMMPSAKGSNKVLAIGQAIMQAARPRSVIAPLQVGLGVQLNHLFGSRQIIDTANHLGFCSSYAETERYLMNAAITSNADVIAESNQNDVFLQFVADNVDHNITTLDGKSTFHGMGIIAIETPAQAAISKVGRDQPSMKDIIENSTIPIIEANHSPNLMPGVIYEIDNSDNHTVSDETEDIDFLWKVCRSFVEVPSLSAFMCSASNLKEHPGVSGITFLPMIDLDPSNVSCILSTMHYVQRMSSERGVTPVLTFDQPLYWKAQSIISSQPNDSPLRNIVLRLGPFHMMMSFLSSIGHIMAGSGLHEAIETCYAENSVTHILSGKAVSRGVRANNIVQAALIGNLIDVCIEIESEGQTNTLHQLKSNILEIITRVTCDNSSFESICGNKDIHAMRACMKSLTDEISYSSRTSALWLQYIEMVDILNRFIKAERTGNFKLHLSCVVEMLPFLAAAGHANYTKSLVIYLKQMESLQETHPKVHDALINGHHVIRRSDRFYAGISSDLAIEQTLMRSLKSSGGLTRKRGFTEGQRALWIKSLPARAAINKAMTTVADTSQGKKQHTEAGNSRIQRDFEDINKVKRFFSLHSPFQCDANLKSIITGEVASPKVNVERAKEIGKKILTSMNSKYVDEWTFTKADQVTTFLSKSPVMVGAEAIHIDQNLLFQRLLSLADRLEVNQKEGFQFELCSFPPALFDRKGLFLDSKKSELANHIWQKHAENQPGHLNPNNPCKFVLDGGALLYRVTWQRPAIYGHILDMYVQYVKSHYGQAVVVFDGYEEKASTKDMTQMKRRGANSSPNVVFGEMNEVSLKREVFFANKANKKSFVHHLGIHLTDAGCRVFHADGDADTLIVKTALEAAREGNTTLVGDDTDLLCLLMYHFSPDVPYRLVMRTSSQKGLSPRQYDIRLLTESVGNLVCQNILFAHAFSGCDTTSRIFGIGKATMMKLIKDDSECRESAEVFLGPANKESIAASGEKMMMKIYGNQGYADIDELRYSKFKQRAASRLTQVEPSSLPPTKAACVQHSMRVYLQVQTWKNLEAHLEPTEWGWELNENSMLWPVYTDKQPAPPDLLKIIRCGCKGNCNTNRCTCRKNGLKCSDVCKECRGFSCKNGLAVDIDIEEREIHEDDDFV